jgi:hypothetical protein
MQSKNNLWLINVFAVTEGIFFISLLYYWSTSHLFKTIIKFSGIIYVIFWFITTIFINSIFEFNDDEKTLKCIILIIGTCYVLTHYAIESTSRIYNEYKFWILTGMMIYFTLCLVIFATSRIILDSNQKAITITFPIHSAINILTNICFIIGYICFIRKTNSSS